MKAIDRVFEYLKTKGIPHTLFEKEIGISNGYLNTQLKRKADLGEGVLLKVIDNCLDINTEWLLTGKGEMLKRKKPREADYNMRDNTPSLHVGEIPLVYGSAVGGFGSAQFSIGEADVKEYYVVPKFKNKQIDFMIEVEGSSMYPKYNSGDVVACRIINESSFIQWNKTHVIATKDQGILLKRIKPAKEKELVTMVSDNKDYDPFEVRMEEISGLAIVVGVIRLE